MSIDANLAVAIVGALVAILTLQFSAVVYWVKAARENEATRNKVDDLVKRVDRIETRHEQEIDRVEGLVSQLLQGFARIEEQIKTLFGRLKT